MKFCQKREENSFLECGEQLEPIREVSLTQRSTQLSGRSINLAGLFYFEAQVGLSAWRGSTTICKVQEPYEQHGWT